jgi:spermidine synthase
MVGPFDWWERNGKLEYEQGDVRIYDMDGDKYLFVGQTMYASTKERSWYVKNVMPHAQGKCLEIGLGLGVASKAILYKPQVKHLLTVEKNPHVIAAFGRPLHRHNILCADAVKWVSEFPVLEPMYDFIFVDHYTFDDETLETLPGLATALKFLLKPDGKMVFWVDENAPEEDRQKVRDLWILS